RSAPLQVARTTLPALTSFISIAGKVSATSCQLFGASCSSRSAPRPSVTAFRHLVCRRSFVDCSVALELSFRGAAGDEESAFALLRPPRPAASQPPSPPSTRIPRPPEKYPCPSALTVVPPRSPSPPQRAWVSPPPSASVSPCSKNPARSLI